MAENHQALESCINEFFAPQTTNERKQEIEGILNTFTNTNDSWKQALFSLNCAADRKEELNEYVSMYCLTILEKTVKYRWALMISDEKNELKSSIYTFLVQHSTPSSGSAQHRKCPHFVRNKIIKVLSDVGKFDWPHSYPNFFTNIYQITQSNETVLLGLVFIKTISEEWPNVKDELSTERKHQLKSLLVREIPKIFQLIHQILVVGLKQRMIGPMASPSSSPQDQDSNAKPHQSFHSQMDEIVQVALEITSHYSTWIPLDCSTSSLTNEQIKMAPFPLEFVQLVCQFGLFDTCPPSSAVGMSHSIHALGALNELLYRKFIPKEFDDQMNFICRFGVELLNKILNQSSISALQEEYLEKVIEFLCLVASSHFHRYDEQVSKAFMSLLLPFTFKQEETAFYYECLEIWSRLLDHLNAQSLIPTRENFLQNFKQPILGFATGIMKSTAKFKVVQDDCFDTEDDDDVEAPSLVRNIDVLVKIGELLPAESLEMVKNTWAETCQFYINLKEHLNSLKTTSMQIPSATELEHFHFIVQLIGRVASIFYGEVFKQELVLGKTLLQQLVLIYNFSKHFYHIREPAIVITANCEIINALRSWTHWLSRYHSEIVIIESTLEDQQAFFEMLSTIIQNIFYSMENHSTIDPSIVLANISFLGTFVNSIRTQYVFQMSCVQTLIQQVHSLKDAYDVEANRLLHKVVATLLLLPWQNVSLQEWDFRTQLYSTYMKRLCQDLINSATNIRNTVFYFRIISDQLELLMTECGTSKKMCWDVLKELVPFLQKLSTMYLRQSGIGEEILNLFLKIMQVLRQQAGVNFFEVTVQGFLSLFSSENIISDLMKENESCSLVVEKFLQMLQFMIKDSSPSFKKFLHDTLAICYDHIYPILAQRSSPDLKITFFQLQRDTLHFRWNYFFPTVVLQQQNNSFANSLFVNPPNQDTKRLDQILQSIGHSFLQSDLEVFRYNLQTLTLLNEKHNLYQKLSSRQIILQQFITVLLQVLIQKTHDLLREDMIRVVHEMSSISSVQFQKSFLPEFLNIHFPRQTFEQRNHLISKFCSVNKKSVDSQPDGSSENNFQIDLPTFTQNLNEFIDDLRHFRFVIECQELCSNSVSNSENSNSSKSNIPANESLSN